MSGTFNLIYFFSFSECGLVFTTDAGPTSTLQSPGYGYGYINNQDCTNTVLNAEGCIVFTFLDLGIQEGSTPLVCDNDYVEVCTLYTEFTVLNTEGCIVSTFLNFKIKKCEHSAFKKAELLLSVIMTMLRYVRCIQSSLEPAWWHFYIAPVQTDEAGVIYPCAFSQGLLSMTWAGKKKETGA